MATTVPTLICPHGHGPGVAGAHFCHACGTPLIPLVELEHPLQAAPAHPIVKPPTECATCGGKGAHLAADQNVCMECRWLRPLLPDYHLERSVFLWAQDGQAMSHLDSFSALTTAARAVSDHVGRPWIEATFNGIRVGPKQLPDVWDIAVLAGRILGLPIMPDVYIAGDSMWQTYTFGSETSSFIVLGTALLNNFHGDDLLFVIAREMGHCRAGHALWKTVLRFVAGNTGPKSSLSGGLMGALSPLKLVWSAVEMPLMMWSRQSEITADRAGLLAVGDETLARRVLLGWSIRSSTFLKRVNIDEWMKQEEDSDATVTRLSEFTTSSAMYTTRRLKLLGQAAKEAEMMRWSASIQPVRKRILPPTPPKPAKTAGPAQKPTVAGDFLRIACAKCQTPMRIPRSVLEGKTSLNVRCPNCQNVVALRPRPVAPSPAPGAQEK
jgi:Zn-dependent protease with chaperone function